MTLAPTAEPSRLSRRIVGTSGAAKGETRRYSDSNRRLAKAVLCARFRHYSPSVAMTRHLRALLATYANFIT